MPNKFAVRLPDPEAAVAAPMAPPTRSAQATRQALASSDEALQRASKLLAATARLLRR
jgi:hypothetical protein